MTPTIMDLDHRQFSRGISQLAQEAMGSLSKGTPAYKEADIRRRKPMDYLRCMEFPLTYRQLSLAPGMKVLDIASPQWFSLLVASRFPSIEFYYINILESELNQIRGIAECLGLRNIQCANEDTRSISFDDGTFNRAVSISAVEHIAPAEGGDLLALKEIHRVLTQSGGLTLSVPFKKERSLVFDSDHPVWEREKKSGNFYMRNYDKNQLEELVKDAGFCIKEKSLMFERPGLFAMEYWESHLGKQRKSRNAVIKLKKKMDKLMGLRLEKFLAAYHLKSEDAARPNDRLMNIVATLVKN